MQEQFSDNELIDNWRGGDGDAATVLYQRYLQKLLNLIGLHLSARFNPRFDAEDVAQSVFKSLFRRAEGGEFTFGDDADFWKLLLTIALNKVRNRVRFHEADKRAASREVSATTGDADGYIMSRLSKNPTAAETVAFSDLFTSMLYCLTKGEQQLLQMRLEGYTQQEIASQLNVDERTVRRMFVRIRKRVVKNFAADLPPEFTGK